MRGEIIFVNKAFCKTYGYSEDEILGKNNSVLWIGKNQSENTRSVFQTRTLSGGWEVGFYHKRKDDSIFPISLSRSTIKDTNKKDVAIVGVARDISERILIEDELRTTSLKFQKRNQTQNEITIIVMEAIQKLLANGQIDMATKVVCDYLDVSKISAGIMEPNRTNFNFVVLVSQVAEALSDFASQKNINLKCSTPGSELVVNADYDRMAQVLSNLLIRAIRFSPENNDVNILVKDNGNELTVEIHDGGIPFEHNKIQRIVNNPEWIKEQFNTDHEDLALGLRVAKEFIEIHGGRIWAESADQKRGNVLCFTVPKSNVRQKAYQEITTANLN